MAYSNTYEASDISAVVIDFIGGIGVQGVAFATIISLSIIFVWMKQNVPKF